MKKVSFLVWDKKKLFTVCGIALAVTVALAVLVPLVMKATSVSITQKQCPIYRVDTEEKKVALSINAAWDDIDTDAFLAILEKYEIKTTFFLVGEFVQRCENAVVRIYAAGHEIGSHSDTHADMAKLDEAGITQELTRSAEKIEKVTGKAPTLFRAPSGSYNNAVISTAENLGYQCIQWDVDTVDWKGKTADEMVKKVSDKVENGSIILLHLGAEHTKEALPKIIETILEKGYEIVPVSELIYPAENSIIDSRGEQHLKQ